MENDIIKALLRELVSDDVIRECVEDVVEQKIDSLFNYTVESTIKQKINSVINEESDAYIRGAVENVINGEVRVDDGWGNTAEYGTFEDLVRKRISKNLSDGWNVERKVREAVDAKIKKICEKVRQEHVDNMAEQVMDILSEKH